MKTRSNVIAGIMLIAGSIIGIIGSVLPMVSPQISQGSAVLAELPLGLAASILFASYLLGAFPGRKGYFTVPTYFTVSAVTSIISFVATFLSYMQIIGRGGGYSDGTMIFSLVTNSVLTALRTAVAVVSFMKFRTKAQKALPVILSAVQSFLALSGIVNVLSQLIGTNAAAPVSSPVRLILSASALSSVSSVLTSAAVLLFILKFRTTRYDPLPDSADPEEELRRFAEMRDSGIISEEEYRARCEDLGVAPAGQTEK